MKVNPSVVDAIGNTPLIRLRRASELTGCDIYGKAEFMNPGGSVKDRAALYIVQDALKRGVLRPGGTIVEGTAGNTGIGLALVGNALGHFSAPATHLLLPLFLGDLLAAPLQLDLQLIERLPCGHNFPPHTCQLRRTRGFVLQLAVEVFQGLLPGLFPVFEHDQAS